LLYFFEDVKMEYINTDSASTSVQGVPKGPPKRVTVKQ
jgi:hypothetical protein